MMNVLVERRESRSRAYACTGSMETQEIVRQGILLQSCVGTLGAVEYMKANVICGAVISRVLSGGAIRQQDRTFRDTPSAWD